MYYVCQLFYLSISLSVCFYPLICQSSPHLIAAQVDVKSIKRVVIIRYDATTQMISFRHYEICTKAVGLSKGVKSLLKVRVPDLSSFSDIKDFVVKCAMFDDHASD
jgi:hypothetical protein